MSNLFNTLPRHPSVLGLFPPQTYGQHDADDSFDLPDASFDVPHGHPDAKGDLSFASTASLSSPLSPPAFQHMESSPYGMDICSPSPGHPNYGKRIVVQPRVEESASKVFGDPSKDFLLPPRNMNPPGTLLKKLRDVSDTNFSPMSVGSQRSGPTNKSTGKVSSIKSTNSIRDADTAGKLRGRSRAALPSAWMQQTSRDSRSGLFSPMGGMSPPNETEEPGDVLMEDAMDIDSPLASRGPPRAELKPRPLSLFIPTSTEPLGSVFAQQGSLEDSPSPAVSALPKDGDGLGAHFYDTPEPESRSLNLFGAKPINRSRSPSPFGARDSSPVASPSAAKYERCLSAGIVPSSSSTSLLSAFATNSRSGSNSGPLSANPISQQSRTKTTLATRIPSLKNRALRRPGLSTLVGQEEVYSDNAPPSRRMATLQPRRVVSAFIPPEKFDMRSQPSQAGVARPRPGGGLAKNRVVSMLVPSTAPLDGEDDRDGMFDSPSARVGAGHRRLRSNGGSGGAPKSAFPGGSLRSRGPAQLVRTIGDHDPSPIRPLLPFGDGEHSGKILPCHSVKDDGLMRITPTTMQALLSGAYDAHIASYQIIDCRFGFEYEGGHIRGAINLNKEEDIERFLFEEAAKRGRLPPPSQSGTPGVRQPILIFHCEFSAKRGPTFAKHFRAKDRSKNAQHYPKLHYPELYILEGGYCSYYSAYPETCEPRGYVQMDAPQFSHARAADLGQFRKWSRVRSYTYGDNQPQPPQPKIGLGITTSQPSLVESNSFQRGPSGVPARQHTGSQRKVDSFYELQTLEEQHDMSEETRLDGLDGSPAPTPTQEEDFGSDAASQGSLPEGDDAQEEQYYDALQGSYEEEPAESQVVEESQEQITSEDEDNFDDMGHVDSSPCVTAEMKRQKSRGRQLLERTFKPLSFGLSLHPHGHSRV
ncbi:SubName: Full=Related to tyrosine phosphatase-Cryptococcus neoformans var. neoformans {ECO:0000313/EMBL:CCA71084.1} [Serendipita indica DSM 11827]|uniref:M-phase inducer phosphatase n=2 Tax=Serendipita indica (strain DSM 11827) TaxID=1109443 RepID=G4TID5_SERID|nr:SubName: Full=Related to tyrosine phosphatase-Cryptococcus neoformans var. neoformans {ECO:0000313/EMBL:CCA71084.1} [Serendipita indica DSM 11827]CCA71084.1 related to tyrosine phosphatase-Cryptococcus neoformans var. neoformans [Serendipita indica DSM 11827]